MSQDNRIVWMGESALVSGWCKNHLLSYFTVLAIRLTRPSKMEGFFFVWSSLRDFNDVVHTLMLTAMHVLSQMVYICPELQIWAINISIGRV